MANNAKVMDIMAQIINNGLEAEVLRLLVDNRLNQIMQLERLSSQRGKSLKLIKAINAKGKQDEAIDALCDESDDKRAMFKTMEWNKRK